MVMNLKKTLLFKDRSVGQIFLNAYSALPRLNKFIARVRAKGRKRAMLSKEDISSFRAEQTARRVHVYARDPKETAPRS